MIKELGKTGRWNGRKPSRSAIYRFVKVHNLQRDPHINPEHNVRPFAFDHFGQLWIADFLHGPKALAAMSPEERDITAVNDSKIIENQVVEIYNRIDDFSDENKTTLALSLKTYWEAHGKWEKKDCSNKQLKKVQKVKNILGQK